MVSLSPLTTYLILTAETFDASGLFMILHYNEQGEVHSETKRGFNRPSRSCSHSYRPVSTTSSPLISTKDESITG